MDTLQGLNGIAAGHGAAGADPARKSQAAVKVAREFESLFVGMMLKSMRETVGKDGLTGGGHGEEVYSSLLDQEYARAMTQHGGIGLARMIEQQLNGPVLARTHSRNTVSPEKGSQRSENEVRHEDR